MTESATTGKVVIVGGGIMGLMSAWMLRLRGWQVTVLDQGDIASEASWAGGGILCPLYPWREPPEVQALVRESLDLYPSLVEQLQLNTELDLGYRASGLVYVSESEGLEAAAWARAAGQALEWRDITGPQGELQVRACLPWVYQVRNPRLCRVLAQTLSQLGVEVSAHESALSIELGNGRAVAVQTKRRRLPADHVCVCAGAWSTPLLRPTGWAPAISPVKGEMLLLRLSQSLADDAIFVGDGFYLITREPDLVLIGSTVSHAAFDKTPTAAARDLLLAAAGRFLPDAEFTIEHHWAGLRPGNVNGVPTVGAHPNIERLWINSGHFRNGLTMAPASAARLAHMIGRST